MLTIKLSRKGKKKLPIYRIIVIEKTKNPQSQYKESLGTYNPHTKEIVIDGERAKYWISVGAQPTPTIHNLMVSQGIIIDDKVKASKSKPGKKKRLATQAAEKADKEKQAADEKSKKELAESKADETQTPKVVETPKEDPLTKVAEASPSVDVTEAEKKEEAPVLVENKPVETKE
ncbi:MAG TPA: 30S ribosomal protein S16 [Patescibacteria group bacterium]|nr:30S ribosomal protein S16 [Patescibacteria group bacterium]